MSDSGYLQRSCPQGTTSVEVSFPAKYSNWSDIVARIAALEDTNRRLNRRCQRNEAALLEKIEGHGASMGRALSHAGYHIEKEKRERAEAALERMTTGAAMAVGAHNDLEKLLEEAEAETTRYKRMLDMDDHFATDRSRSRGKNP